MPIPIKVILIFGTRPEAIKMCPLVRVLRDNPSFETKVCVTGQHREMLDSVLDIFKVVPEYDLNIMSSGQTLNDITVRILERLGAVIADFKPDLLLVHGDTTTTFASALAAFYAKVPVGHVEAGLRTYDKYSPFPEEINRTLTGHIADLHFAPTARNRGNLARENVTKGVYITGNTVIDALSSTVRPDYAFKTPGLSEFLSEGRLILLTAHRRENIGEPFENIFRAVRSIADENEDVRFFYPVHLNTLVQEPAKRFLSGHPRIMLSEPTDVEETHNIMSRAYMVMTDSGGIQEEAPALGKPVLVLRRETERPEAVEAGTVKIAGVDENTIFDMASQLLHDASEYDKMARAVNPYGDGKACLRIMKSILHSFGQGERPEDFNTSSRA